MSLRTNRRSSDDGEMPDVNLATAVTVNRFLPKFARVFTLKDLANFTSVLNIRFEKVSKPAVPFCYLLIILNVNYYLA